MCGDRVVGTKAHLLFTAVQTVPNTAVRRQKRKLATFYSHQGPRVIRVLQVGAGLHASGIKEFCQPHMDSDLQTFLNVDLEYDRRLHIPEALESECGVRIPNSSLRK